jgi:hypothetical protein
MVNKAVKEFLDENAIIVSSLSDHAELSSSKAVANDAWPCTAHGHQLVVERSLGHQQLKKYMKKVCSFVGSFEWFE